MRTLIILLSILCFSIFAQDTLSVMTYNLEGMKPGTDPETRLYYIIQNLKVLNPDIIGLQEINEYLSGSKNQGQRIADSLSAYFGISYYFYQGFTHLAWNNQYREYVGIVSKYPVQNQGYLELVPGIFPRKVVWNYINTPLGMVNFFNTHLSFSSSTVRVQQVQQIIPYVTQQETTYAGVGSILTGDFNDPPTAQSIQLLTNTGTDTFFIDTYPLVNPTNPGFTAPSNAPSNRIDYIFLKSTGHLSVVDSRVVMNQPYSGNNFCSDHLGVLTRFVLNPVGIEPNGALNFTPQKTLVWRNYPNPFNPVTTIEYQIPAGTKVTLKVLDVLGREVTTLVNEYQSAGHYQIRWKAVDRPSGIYFYQIQAGDFQSIQKMVLIR